MPNVEIHNTTRQKVLDYVSSNDIGDDYVLLFSGMESQSSGQTSYLATAPDAIVTPASLTELTLPSDNSQWFGYIGYEAHALEKPMACSIIELPNIWLMNPSQISLFKHEAHEEQRISIPTAIAPFVTSLHSNMNKTDYLRHIEHTIERIHAGDFYQANITRKFYGECDNVIDPVELFTRLCSASPAPYSALIRMGDIFIISSSPESFLSIDDTGRIETRPIKGSAPRDIDSQKDAQIKQSLINSAKDKAENLMIVDLMRNDLSQSCVPGSINVSDLQEVHSFATIHQMISTVSGRKREDALALDVIEGGFPPGSMTGAPKRKVIKWIAAQEPHQRGVYSGTIGWVKGNESCDLSVVIRTIIVQGNRFEFQVGGGIVADSDPEKEWEETLIKARGICAALGIKESQLCAL